MSIKITLNNQKGQSLAELLIGMTIFSIVAATVMFLVLGSHKSSLQSQEISQAISVTNEGITAAKASLEYSLNSPDCVSNTAFEIVVDDYGSHWSPVGENTTELLYDKYTRQVGIYPLFRDGGGNISEEAVGNTFDPYLRRIVATTTWPRALNPTKTSEYVLESYFSPWKRTSYVEPTTWSGTKTGVVVESSALKLAPAGAFYGTSGSYQSPAKDTGSAKPQYLLIEFDYEWEY